MHGLDSSFSRALHWVLCQVASSQFTGPTWTGYVESDHEASIAAGWACETRGPTRGIGCIAHELPFGQFAGDESSQIEEEVSKDCIETCPI